MTRLTGTVSLIALCAAPLSAQEAFDLEEITIFGGFENVSTLDTGIAVDIIDADTLARSNETRVVDFLARQPSISVRSTGPVGSLTGLSIRGVSQNNIGVRVDGIDVSDPSGTQVAFDFGSLMTSDISRIEILRGTQSAGFGSEALGGVINITTKRATRDGLAANAAIELGSFRTLKSAVTLTNRGDGHETAATLSYIVSDGFSAADEDNGNTEADGYEARRLSLSGRYAVGDGATLSFSAFAENAEFDYDESSAGVISDGTPDDVTQRQQRGARVGLEFATGAVDNTVYIASFRSYRQLSGSNGFGPFEFNYEGKRLEFGYQAGMDVGATGRLNLGLSRTSETYEDWSAFGSQTHDTTIDSLSAEYRAAPTDVLDVSLALRHDRHSQFGNFTTGRLSLAYRLQDDLILRANAATGYRAPSNYELYDGFSGNAGLEPETSRSADIGIEKRYGGNSFARATAFWVEAEDIIDYSFTTFGYVQRSGTATRKGLELAGGLDLSDRLSLTGAYTLTESDSNVTLDSSSWTTSVARHALSLGVTAQLTDRASLAVDGLWESDRVDLEDYAVINSTLTYDVTDRLQGYLRVENLFDAEYQSVPGYGTAERSFFVGLRASF